MLLGGRFVALAINLAVQVLIVRYLSRQGYGAFAYALAMADLGATITILGFDKAIRRFVTIYSENGDYPRVFGTAVLAVSVMTTLSALLIGSLFAVQSSLGGWMNAGPESVALLLILMLLAPLQALDAVIGSFHAVFSRPRAIVFRKHFLGPGLKLASVLSVMTLAGDAQWLASAYVASSLIGIVIYGSLLIRVLGRDGHFARWESKRIVLPYREVLGYSLPMLSSDLVFLIHNSAIVFFLEYFHSTSDVAAFQAVKPFSRLNTVVLQSFLVLYLPAIARFIARDDDAGLAQFYRETAWWVAILAFPLFAVTMTFSDSIASWVLGGNYADTGGLLALMAAGYFCHAVLGVNAHTLKALREIKRVLIVDGLTAALAFICCYFVIARVGAVGAVLTFNVVLVFHGLANMTALRLSRGIEPFSAALAIPYTMLGCGVGVLAVQKFLLPANWIAQFGALGLAMFLCVLGARRVGRLDDIFPEVRRLPGFAR